MYAITGALGQTGTAVVETLLKAGHAVRLIVRANDGRADAFKAQGAELRIVDLHDQAGLTAAFQEVKGAYLMNPPAYKNQDLFAEARLIHQTLIAAANQAQVPHVVALSSVGAHQSKGTGNILTTHDFEQQLQNLKGVCSILRAANFMENWSWSIAPVVPQGILPSMFLPLNRALPMVAARDIGACAAHLLINAATANNITELHGLQDYSPIDAAHVFAELTGKPVEAVETPRTQWPEIFSGMGFPPKTVEAFCGMFDGFNNGTVSFEGIHNIQRGTTDLRTALQACLMTAQAAESSPQPTRIPELNQH